MAIKTFSVGEVLTASDTNAYLANAGLVYVTSLSFSTSATAQISNCFTSTYDSYRIVLTTSAFSGNPNLYWQLTASGTPNATNYFWAANYVTALGGSGMSNGNPGTAMAAPFCSTTYPQGHQIIDMYGPALAQTTSFTFADVHHDSTTVATRTGGGGHFVATAYDGIRFTVSTGTMSGVLTVLGYRKA